MITIACVLKTGGWKNRHINVEYHPRQVIWLRDQVARHVKCDYRFVCFSDIEIEGVEVIPLTDDLPGWWSKIEMFKHDLGKVFYLDLDTVIIDDITHMVKYDHKFSVLRNLSSKADSRIGSGIMAWSGDQSHIYHDFMKDPDRHMRECTTSSNWGDQGYLQHYLNGKWEYLQDIFPAQMGSYKFDFAQGNPWRGARIVIFHGAPKPWETAHEWVPKLPL
jgi:hypothetical protein